MSALLGRVVARITVRLFNAHFPSHDLTQGLAAFATLSSSRTAMPGSTRSPLTRPAAKAARCRDNGASETRQSPSGDVFLQARIGVSCHIFPRREAGHAEGSPPVTASPRQVAQHRPGQYPVHAAHSQRLLNPRRPQAPTDELPEALRGRVQPSSAPGDRFRPNADPSEPLSCHIR
jgi:hypothetical protein